MWRGVLGQLEVPLDSFGASEVVTRHFLDREASGNEFPHLLMRNDVVTIVEITIARFAGACVQVSSVALASVLLYQIGSNFEVFAVGAKTFLGEGDHGSGYLMSAMM